MKNNLLKYFSFLFTLTLLSCEASGDDDGGGGGGTVSNPPGKSTLIAPANNKACESGTSISETKSEVTFTWEVSAKTNTYNLQITNLSSGGGSLLSTGILTTTKKVTLDKGIPYSWNITSINNTTKSTISDTWKFYLEGIGIVNYAPFPAEIIEPNESIVARDSEGKVTFTWVGSDPDAGDTLKYTLYVDTTDGKQSPPSNQTDLTLKTLVVSLESATTYYCRVKTSDGINNSYSTIYSFKTE